MIVWYYVYVCLGYQPDFSLDQENFSSFYMAASQSKIPTHNFAQRFKSSFEIEITLIKYKFEDNILLKT